MASSSATPRKRQGRKLSVRFISDDDVGDIIKPLKDSKTWQSGKQNDPSATPKSSRRRLRSSLREPIKEEEIFSEDDIDDSMPEVKLGFDEEIENRVSGKQIYGFRTPKKEGQMTRLANESVKALTTKSKDKKTTEKLKLTPKSENKSANKRNDSQADKIHMTPKSRKSDVFKSELMIENSRTPTRQYEVVKTELDMENSKTPYNLRLKIKRRIVNMIEEEKSDFSSSESEYAPSDKEESSNEEDLEEPEEQKHKTILQLTSATKRNENKYVYSAEDYFNSRKSSKAQTSNHTLGRLKTPKLSQSALKEILQKMKSPHEKQIRKLNMDYQRYYNKWLFILRQGFNILLYGLGSKRNTMNTFHEQLLSESQVIVINGFFPGLSLKKIFHCITEEILGLKSNPVSLLECVSVIQERFNESSGEELFIIVHNIDGLTLRNEQSQTLFSKLASVKNIHFIASIDHINSPLLWDPMMLSQFNFLWFDTTTMLPYIEETSFENSVMVKQSGALALSSLRSVYNSLTSNAKGVFLIIVKHQLEHRGNSSYAGISFRDIYWKSREAFLLSSDLALRAQLTEFLDHHMVKSKIGSDGDEKLLIPIDNSILQDFLDELNEA